MTTPARVGVRRAGGDELTAFLRGLSGRVDRVELARRVAHTSIEDGTLRVGEGGRIVLGDEPDAPTLDLSPLDPPASLAVEAGVVEGAAYVDAGWPEVPGAVGYDVVVEVDGFGVIRTERTSGLVVRIAPLAGLTDHTVRVSAVSLAGRLSSTVSASVTTPEVPGAGGPSAPPTSSPSLSVAGGFSTLIVSYPRVDDADRYAIEVYDDASALVAELEATANVVAIALDPGDYTVRAAAGNAEGFGPWSTAVPGTVADAPSRDYSVDPITDGELADDAVRTRHVLAGQIVSDHVVAAGLDAAVVRFGTMDGDRIEVGTLDGDRIIAGTIEVDKLTTGTLDAATVTLGAGGLLRAGRVSAPYHYLTLGETGLRFLRDGSAPYTGGDQVLALDVATGLAALTNATIESSDGTRSVDVAEGSVGIVVGSTTVGRLSGQLHVPAGDVDPLPSVAIETPSVDGWTGPSYRAFASEQTIELRATNGVRVEQGSFTVELGDVTAVGGTVRAFEVQADEGGFFTRGRISVRTGFSGAGFNEVALLSTTDLNNRYADWLQASAGSSSVAITVGGTERVAGITLRGSGGVDIPTGRLEVTSNAVEATSPSWRQHFRAIRSGNRADLTVGAVGRGELHYSQTLALTFTPSLVEVSGQLTTGGKLTVPDEVEAFQLKINGSVATVAGRPILTEGVWVPVTFNTGWANFSGAWVQTEYMVVGNLCYLKGMVTRNSGSSLIIAHTLPRPKAQAIYPAASAESPTYIHLEQTSGAGRIRIRAGADFFTSRVSLGMIVYEIE